MDDWRSAPVEDALSFGPWPGAYHHSSHPKSSDIGIAGKQLRFEPHDFQTAALDPRTFLPAYFTTGRVPHRSSIRPPSHPGKYPSNVKRDSCFHGEYDQAAEKQQSHCGTYLVFKGEHARGEATFFNWLPAANPLMLVRLELLRFAYVQNQPNELVLSITSENRAQCICKLDASAI
jgi:hypothetical protein